MRKPSLCILLVSLISVFLIASCSDDDGPSGPGDNNPPVDVTLVAADRANGDIYEVDPTTGEETLLIDTWTDVVMRVPESLGRVSSIVYVPATSSWWLGGGGTATCAGCILILDPATGEAVTLSSPEGAHHGGGVSGMAIHPDNGRIFTFCSDCGNDFFEIDPATGAWTQLPDAVGTGGNGNGTTFSSDGVLHVASDGHLFRVDHTDSSVDDLGEFTYTGFPAFSGTRQPIVAMTTRPSDGAVFGILLDGGGQGNPGASYLIRVNLGTAEVTNVGKSDTMLGGLAFVPTAILD